MSIDNRENEPQAKNIEKILVDTAELYKADLRKLRRDTTSPEISVIFDLSSLSEADYVAAARWLKAFLEQGGGTQKRTARIKAKEEQRSWEENVLGSGVDFVAIN